MSDTEYHLLKFESTLEENNFLNLPEQLCEQWNVETGDTLYAYIANKRLILTKEPNRIASSVVVIPGFFIILPEYLVETMNFHMDCKVSLTLEDNIVIVSKQRILYLYSPNHKPTSEEDDDETFKLELKDILRIKVEHELDAYKDHVSTSDYMQILTDIGMHISFAAWTDDQIEIMLRQKNLLKELAWKFLDDTEYNELFYKKIPQFVSEYK